MITKLTIAGLISGAVLMALQGGASAQYPPPNGGCELRTSATSTETNSSVDVTVVLRDLNGHTVPGAPVSLGIGSQPGGATLAVASSKTDANGKLNGTLAAGSEAGTIRLEATADGVSCSGSLAVGTGAVSPAIIFPDTGTGPSDDGNSTFALVITALLEVGGLVLILGYAGSRIARRR